MNPSNVEALVPIGQESFVDPDHARQLPYANWTADWIQKNIGKVQPSEAAKKK